MNKITSQAIEQYIENKNFSSKKTAQPYTSVLTNFSKIVDMVGDSETVDQLFQRFIIGKSASSTKFAKSVIYDFVNKSQNQDIKDDFIATRDNTKVSSGTIAQDEESLRQAQELAKIQADELRKTQEEAQKKAEELEAKKIQEAKIKAELEAQRKQELRDQRIKARTEGFISEDFPAYIEQFDYMKNIPNKAREYFAQGSEQNMLKLCADMGKHTILSGSAGSGKTEVIIKYAHENQIPIFKMSCSSDVRMDDLIGSKTIDSDGSIKFQAGMLLKAVLTANKHGKAIILLDEINTLAEKVQKNINGLADGTGFIDLPMGRIAINQGVQFLIAGTMNLSYAGTNPLNPELKDRFTVIDMPKMSNETKHKIYSKYQVSEEIEDNLIELSKAIEEKQKDNEIAGDVVFSTRSQITFLEIYEELNAEGIPNAVDEALNISLVSKFDDEDDKQTIRDLIEYNFD